MQSNY